MTTSSPRRRLVGELDVRAAGRHPDRPGAGEGGVSQALVLGVRKRLLRRDRPRVAGVHSHRVEVLDRADDDAVAGPVGHHLELELLPALNRPLDEHLADRARLEPAHDLGAELLLGVGEPSPGAAERERGPNDGRRPAGRQRLGRAHHHAVGHGEAGGSHRVPELLPILGAADGIQARADQLDAEALEHSRLAERDGEIQRGLPAERRQQRVGTLLLDDRRHSLDVQGLDVRRVGPLGVGHDRRRVRVDEHDAIALGPQDAAGLRARVVELACLPDADRARADDQDAA